MTKIIVVLSFVALTRGIRHHADRGREEHPSQDATTLGRQETESALVETVSLANDLARTDEWTSSTTCCCRPTKFGIGWDGTTGDCLAKLDSFFHPKSMLCCKPVGTFGCFGKVKYASSYCQAATTTTTTKATVSCPGCQAFGFKTEYEMKQELAREKATEKAAEAARAPMTKSECIHASTIMDKEVNPIMKGMKLSKHLHQFLKAKNMMEKQEDAEYMVLSGCGRQAIPEFSQRRNIAEASAALADDWSGPTASTPVPVRHPSPVKASSPVPPRPVAPAPVPAPKPPKPPRPNYPPPKKRSDPVLALVQCLQAKRVVDRVSNPALKLTALQRFLKRVGSQGDPQTEKAAMEQIVGHCVRNKRPRRRGKRSRKSSAKRSRTSSVKKSNTSAIGSGARKKVEHSDVVTSEFLKDHRLQRYVGMKKKGMTKAQIQNALRRNMHILKQQQLLQPEVECFTSLLFDGVQSCNVKVMLKKHDESVRSIAAAVAVTAQAPAAKDSVKHDNVHVKVIEDAVKDADGVGEVMKKAILNTADFRKIKRMKMFGLPKSAVIIKLGRESDTLLKKYTQAQLDCIPKLIYDNIEECRVEVPKPVLSREEQAFFNAKQSLAFLNKRVGGQVVHVDWATKVFEIDIPSLESLQQGNKDRHSQKISLLPSELQLPLGILCAKLGDPPYENLLAEIAEGETSLTMDQQDVMLRALRIIDHTIEELMPIFHKNKQQVIDDPEPPIQFVSANIPYVAQGVNLTNMLHCIKARSELKERIDEWHTDLFHIMKFYDEASALMMNIAQSANGFVASLLQARITMQQRNIPNFNDTAHEYDRMIRDLRNNGGYGFSPMTTAQCKSAKKAMDDADRTDYDKRVKALVQYLHVENLQADEKAPLRHHGVEAQIAQGCPEHAIVPIVALYNVLSSPDKRLRNALVKQQPELIDFALPYVNVFGAYLQSEKEHGSDIGTLLSKCKYFLGRFPRPSSGISLRGAKAAFRRMTVDIGRCNKKMKGGADPALQMIGEAVNSLTSRVESIQETVFRTIGMGGAEPFLPHTGSGIDSLRLQIFLDHLDKPGSEQDDYRIRGDHTTEPAYSLFDLTDDETFRESLLSFCGKVITMDSRANPNNYGT